MNRIAMLFAAAMLVSAAENTLSPEEKQDGWKLLFDGKSMAGWKDPAKKNVSNTAWVVEDGALKTVVEGARFSEDLISDKSFGDFELRFDWKLSERGNTGLKYRLQREVFLDESKHSGRFEEMLGAETASPKSDRKTFASGKAQLYTVGFEFQLLDDDRHPDGQKDASHRTGALYSFIEPAKNASKPVGEWNTSVLKVSGDRFEHWVNGTEVLAGSLRDPAVKAGADKRWAPAPVVRDLLVNAKPRGPIALQHHGDVVWFRNIKLRAAR